MNNCTHTYVVLELSEKAFSEIKSKLEQAGYQHTFHDEPAHSGKPARLVIDMHGIAVAGE